MRILVVGLNYAPEPIGIAVYTTGLCEDLADRGHEVRVVAAKPFYPGWKTERGLKRFYPSFDNLFRLKVLRVPLYVPKVPTGFKRILHYLSFAIVAIIPSLALSLRFRPHVVLAIAPTLISAPVAVAAARVSGAKSWLHIQDFEIEAAFATGLLSSDSAMAMRAKDFEKWIFGKFDRISAISTEMVARLRSKGVSAERTYELRNWADIERVKPLEWESSYRAGWNLQDKFVALYSGNVAKKQGVEIILQCARRLQSNTAIRFVICGDGPALAELRKAAEGLANVRIEELQPKERLGDLLGLANVHLLPQKGAAAGLLLPSKLVNMLASGIPVVATAAAGTELANAVEGCGIIVPPEDPVAMADAITYLFENDEIRTNLGRGARKRAEASWSPQQILHDFQDELRDFLARKPTGFAAGSE